jgi:hypothetical protein
MDTSPDTAVIGQDEDAEVRVQPVGGAAGRRIDVRLWRRGPGGLTPTADALILDRADLDALCQGIDELLGASEGGKQVARIVLDSAGDRRLRAETEPFGTRHLAHFGFWQRARSSWKQDGDGMDIDADVLVPLLGALREFQNWLDAEPEEQPEVMDVQRPDLDPWPRPGADWLTVEPGRVALHPRGVRVTFSVEEHDARHILSIRQWRREDSLWLPEAVSLGITIADLDAILTALRFMHADGETEREITLEGGSIIRVSLQGESLCIEQKTASGLEPRLAVPTEWLPRLGRAMAEAWNLLLVDLSPDERQQIRTLDLQMPAELPAPEPEPEPVKPPARTIGPSYPFAEESEHPGAVIPQEGQVRIVTEGYLTPRGITLPAEALPRVVTGLEEMYALQLTQPRIAPMLMCDRPDSAVYGRVGTTVRPDAVELRVWLGPTESETITFERIYLLQVIAGLRHALNVLGIQQPAPSTSFLLSQQLQEQHAEPEPEPEQEPATEVSAPAEPKPAPPPSVHITELQVGRQFVRLAISGSEESRSLAILWEGQALELPVQHLEETLADIRSLYYDALRGQRGRTLTVGAASPVEIRIHNQGAQLQLELRHAGDDHDAALMFPAGEIPIFLNAARAALQQT